MAIKTDEVLKKIQAGIVKSHGRKNVWLLFIEFKNKNIESVNSWITSLEVTSAYAQREDTLAFHERKKTRIEVKENIILNCFLSPIGFKYLLKKNDTTSANKNLHNNFLDGMKKNKDILKDPSYQPNYQKRFHVLLTLASNCESILTKKVIEIERQLSSKGIGSIIFKEFGKKIFNKNKQNEDILEEPIEPFGYRDGLTKMNFFKDGELMEDKLKLVLITIEEGDSLLVYRKLKQDVFGFKKGISDLAVQANIPEEFIEGQVMGRFKNGKPILFVPNSKEAVTYKNMANFNELVKDYSQVDNNELKCPLHAHIRKVNTRKNNEPPLIIRRSIPYFYSNENQGLLFMCYQKNIFQQFIEVQKWSNDDISYLGGTGFDVVAGQGKKRVGQKWIKEWGKSQTESTFNFNQYVHLQGGEYFYVPSMRFFNKSASLKKQLETISDNLQKNLGE